VWAVPHLCGFYPGICLTTEEKVRKNLNQGSRRVPAGTMKIHKHTIRIRRHNNKNTKITVLNSYKIIYYILCMYNYIIQNKKWYCCTKSGDCVSNVCRRVMLHVCNHLRSSSWFQTYSRWVTFPDRYMILMIVRNTYRVFQTESATLWGSLP